MTSTRRSGTLAAVLTASLSGGPYGRFPDGMRRHLLGSVVCDSCRVSNGATPTGTVTFLFTDIEDSTRIWQADSKAMGEAVATHDRLMRSCIEGAGGYVFALGGDSFAAAFQVVDAAADAAVSAQEALRNEAWPTAEPLRVRMGIHTGAAELRAGNYFGPTVNRTARLMSAGHGGQILLSEVSASLLSGDHAVRDLGERKLADIDGSEHVHQIGHARFPPLRAVALFSCDVPVARTELVGREKELSTVDETLRSSRLVTLVGTGGTGKTRLAFEAARVAQARFEAGVRLVDLAAITDPGDVGASIARAVDAVPGGDPIAAAAAAIDARDVLLVVDNCEHVIEAVADDIDTLLTACPHVVVLATSREPLEIDGESVYPVPPLDPAGAGSELFRTRVGAAGVDPLQFDPFDVTVLCTRLDGLPLAIELAAARARTLNPAEVIARLDAGDDLHSGRRRRRRRHDTLEATIAWSYDLLDDDERLVLRRCALFESDFPLEGIQATSALSAGATVEALDGLVAKSLVVRMPATGEAAASRYRLLETIRDFAADRLAHDDDLDDAQNRLVDYAVNLFDGWLAGAARQRVLDELVAQRTAITNAARYADARGRLDALGDILQLSMLGWLAEPTTASPEDLISPASLEALPEELRGTLVVQRAIRHLNLGEVDACLEAADQALQLSKNRDTLYGATALSVQARLLAYVDPEAGLAMSEHAFEMRKRADPIPRLHASGDAGWMWRMHDHASNLIAVGDMNAAWDVLLDAARLGPDVNPLAHHMLFADILWTSILVERPDEGLALADAALGSDLQASRRWLSHPTILPISHAGALAAAGDPGQAERNLLAAVESWPDAGDAPRWSTCLVGFAVAAFHAGDRERAMRLLRPVPKAVMSVLMVRRHYRSRLGVPPRSSAPLESGRDADRDVTEIQASLHDEIRHVRRLLTEG